MWDTALQNFYLSHERPNRPYQGSFKLETPQIKCCLINFWHQCPPSWMFSASWPLVSKHQGHLKSTHTLVDARQVTEKSHGKSRLKRSGQWNSHQLLADGWFRSYRFGVKSEHAYCVHWSRLLSNPVTYCYCNWYTLIWFKHVCGKQCSTEYLFPGIGRLSDTCSLICNNFWCYSVCCYEINKLGGTKWEVDTMVYSIPSHFL